MRHHVTALAMGFSLLAGPSAAQFTEETVEVPISRETRDAALRSGPGEPSEKGWREAAAPYDVERIEGNDEAYGRAMEVARTAGSEGARTLLLETLRALPRPIEPRALTGQWECRAIRITYDPPGLRIYGWWNCQIVEFSAGLLLEKITGEELTSGYLYPESDTRMIYLGHRHARVEPARPYDGPDGPQGDDVENRDDPGILTVRGEDRLILAKPRPTIADSDYDFLEFRRPR